MTKDILVAILERVGNSDLDGLRYMVMWNDLTAQMRKAKTPIDLSGIKLNRCSFRTPTERDIAHLVAHDFYDGERDIENFNATIIKEYADSYTPLRWNFADAIFDEAVLEQVEFSGANMSGVKIRKAELVLACSFDGTDLSHADLSDTTFGECSFKGATLDTCDLRRSWLLNSEFDGSNVGLADFRDAAITAEQLVTAEGVESCAPHTLSLELKVNKLLAALSGE